MRFSKLKQKRLLVKLLQDSRKRRKERQWKILFLLQLKGQMLLLQVFFLTQALLFSFENSNAVRSYRCLLRNNYRWFEQTCVEYIQWCEVLYFQKTFRVSKATVSFILDCIKHALQRHTVTEEIDPIAPALDWQYAFTAFHCFHERVFISGRTNIPCACSVKENSPRSFPRERSPSKIH